MGTELVILLDRSASMRGREASALRQTAEILERQKRQPGPCWVTTLLLDTECRILHDRLPIEEVLPPEGIRCAAGGATSLRDAICRGIEHVERVHRYLRKEDVPERVSFQIISDGIDNTSRTDAESMDGRIAEKQAAGWQFRMVCPEREGPESSAPEWDRLDGEGLDRLIEQTFRELQSDRRR